jgi:hypothetical protein
MSSRIEALCILALCLCGILCSSVGVDDTVFVLRIPGVGVEVEVRAVPSHRSVERYAETVDTSLSKAISALVRLDLESQENRKREFFKRLRENLAKEDPKQEDRLVDEFRSLILGR